MNIYAVWVAVWVDVHGYRDLTAKLFVLVPRVVHKVTTVECTSKHMDEVLFEICV